MAKAKSNHGISHLKPQECFFVEKQKLEEQEQGYCIMFYQGGNYQANQTHPNLTFNPGTVINSFKSTIRTCLKEF